MLLIDRRHLPADRRGAHDPAMHHAGHLDVDAEHGGAGDLDRTVDARQRTAMAYDPPFRLRLDPRRARHRLRGRGGCDIAKADAAAA
jgi:hypothetical protein